MKQFKFDNLCVVASLAYFFFDAAYHSASVVLIATLFSAWTKYLESGRTDGEYEKLEEALKKLQREVTGVKLKIGLER